MNTKYYSKGTDTEYPHMLNSTLCATELAMCCLVENYQTKDGVRVPRALVPFMLGQDFLPFVKPPPGGAKAEKPAVAKAGGGSGAPKAEAGGGGSPKAGAKGKKK